MQMIIEAEDLYNAKHRCRRDSLKLQLFAIEKNSSAIVTLKYRNNVQ